MNISEIEKKKKRAKIVAVLLLVGPLINGLFIAYVGVKAETEFYLLISLCFLSYFVVLLFFFKSLYNLFRELERNHFD